MTDYPQGDGTPECPICKGRGVIPLPRGLDHPIDRTQPCPCVMVRDVARNINRGWKGLLSADPVDQSPLRGDDLTESNIKITGSRPTFRSHMKHVAARMPPTWGFLVVSDADLMDAWLSYKLDVKDADVDQMRQRADIQRYDALVDLVEPPVLLVLVCGVKAARNEAMPEVLLEALRHREHINRVTWVVDSPSYPLRDGHISYSHAVGEFLSEWDNLTLPEKTDAAFPVVPGVPYGVVPTTRPPSRTKRPPMQEVADETATAFEEELAGGPPAKVVGPSPLANGTFSMLDGTEGDAPEKKKWGKKR